MKPMQALWIVLLALAMVTGMMLFLEEHVLGIIQTVACGVLLVLKLTKL